MELQFIELGKLSVSKANMRYAKKAPDVADLLPTVRKRGVIVPVLVRANPAASVVEGPAASSVEGSRPETFEIVAGARRFHAAGLIAEERRAAGLDIDPMPCAILSDSDDADAIEASLIENVARREALLGQVSKTVLFVVMRGRPTAALTQRAGGGRPVPRIAQRCLIAA